MLQTFTVFGVPATLPDPDKIPFAENFNGFYPKVNTFFLFLYQKPVFHEFQLV